ncbi:TIR domain-containing protein [Paenibacillus sacheonensis]|uniref:TIR domain-containing protein n=1 Tax=Paenibacillus sacheonensis TaxID=742054 RepID=UPI00308425B3|nr:putative nucleotide-binding protein [Paenibacillus sacheonensis]
MTTTTRARKPNVFIGCSREAIDYARAAASHLERKAQVNPWYAGTFGAGDYTMEALERELAANDFGVFIFAAEDVAMIRGRLTFVTRDNTLFELGLFWGKLGRRRVYCMIPRDIPSFPDGIAAGSGAAELHLPSDLAGLTLLEYGTRTDGKFTAAVDTACGELLTIIERESLYSDPIRQLAEQQSVLERKQSILHFFWEYVRNAAILDGEQRYAAFAEAIRNSFLAPAGFRTTGAAVWRKEGDMHVRQAGGNVGRGRTYTIKANEGKSAGASNIYVLDAFRTGEWVFFNRREIAEVYILCYPLGTEHVLSVHIAGTAALSGDRLAEVVAVNDELLSTISYLVGGDSR